MLDEMDRAYFSQKLRHATEKAQAAKDENTVRTYNALAAEYERKLRELPQQSFA
jgi:hypothetical protein